MKHVSFARYFGKLAVRAPRSALTALWCASVAVMLFSATAYASDVAGVIDTSAPVLMAAVLAPPAGFSRVVRASAQSSTSIAGSTQSLGRVWPDKPDPSWLTLPQSQQKSQQKSQAALEHREANPPVLQMPLPLPLPMPAFPTAQRVNLPASKYVPQEMLIATEEQSLGTVLPFKPSASWLSTPARQTVASLRREPSRLNNLAQSGAELTPLGVAPNAESVRGLSPPISSEQITPLFPSSVR